MTCLAVTIGAKPLPDILDSWLISFLSAGVTRTPTIVSLVLLRPLPEVTVQHKPAIRAGRLSERKTCGEMRNQHGRDSAVGGDGRELARRTPRLSTCSAGRVGVTAMKPGPIHAARHAVSMIESLSPFRFCFGRFRVRSSFRARSFSSIGTPPSTVSDLPTMARAASCYAARCRPSAFCSCSGRCCLA